MAPPWANPKLNPCATQPRGWQLLYWPPDGQCYKIFQVKTALKSRLFKNIVILHYLSALTELKSLL